MTVHLVSVLCHYCQLCPVHTICQTVWLETVCISSIVDAHRDVEAIDEGDIVPVETSSIDGELGKCGWWNSCIYTLESTVTTPC